MNDESKIVVEHVDTIKNKVDLLTGESSDLKTLNDIITVCKAAKKKIKTAHDAYYIIVVEAGDYDNITRYYIPIGLASLINAEKLAKKYCKNIGGFNYRLKEASRELYSIYISLSNLNDVQYILPKLCYTSTGRNYDLESFVEKERANLRKKLNLRHDWEYVVNENEVRNG